MEFRNLTPFPPLIFESVDEDRTKFGVVVLRGTFNIGANNELLASEIQEDILTQDEFYGEPNESSMKISSNLAPFKPTSDIHINANAHSPSGKPEQRWNIKVEIGELVKEIHVTGPRSYNKEASNWELSEPIEVTQVQLNYEKAYGGFFEKGKAIKTHPQNFIGAGFNDNSEEKDTFTAPQIVSIEDQDPKFGETTKVEGIGAIAPTWLPRAKYAGTYDDEWLENTWPHLPSDFKFEFWNSAHPDLITSEYLKGDEIVRLHHLSPEKLISFSLPGYEMYLLCRMQDGNMIKSPLHLDTLHIDVPAKKVFLAWRGLYPVEAPTRVLEARIKVPANQQAQPQSS